MTFSSTMISAASTLSATTTSFLLLGGTLELFAVLALALCLSKWRTT